MDNQSKTKNCEGPVEVHLVSDNTDANEKEKTESARVETYEKISNITKVQVLKIASKIKYQKAVVKKRIVIPQMKEFELGDVVKVSYSPKELKWIQKQTTGWDIRLRRVAARCGYITRKSCGFGTNVVVRYPGISFAAYYYPGVLEKVSQEEQQSHAEDLQNQNPFPQFKDAIVSTIPNWDVLQVLQIGISKLPKHNCSENGKKVEGRVIKQFSGKILVSFNNREAFLMHPGALNIEEKKVFEYPSSVLTYPSPENPFKVGEIVKVTTSIKMLLKHDRKLHIRNGNLSEIAGREVKITEIKRENHVIVSRNEDYSPTWFIGASYLFRDGEDDPKKNGELWPFYPGDVVKIRKVENIAEVLKQSRIPLTFLEYLQTPFEILYYTEDVNKPHPILKIMSNYFVLSSKFLEKVTDEEEKRYREWKQKSENLKVGGKVFLDVGPPNYVREVLEEFGSSEDVIQALITSAKVTKFLEPYHVQIKYPGGKQYIIHRRFLTDPGKFSVDDEKIEFGMQEINGIVSEILEVIQDEGRKAGRKSKPPLDIISMSSQKGNPPMIQMLVYSAKMSQAEVLDSLRKKQGLEMKMLAEDLLQVTGFKSYKQNVKIKIKITHDPFEEPSKKKKLGFIQEPDTAGRLGGRVHPGRSYAGVGSSRGVEPEEKFTTQEQYATIHSESLEELEESSEEYPPPDDGQPGDNDPEGSDPGNGDAGRGREQLKLYRLPLRDGRMGRNVNFLYEIGEKIKATGPDQDQSPIIIPIRGGEGNRHDYQPVVVDDE